MCKKDSDIPSQMANKMTEYTEMMKLYMQKIKEKGMMHPDGKMMDTEEKSNHYNHKNKK